MDLGTETNHQKISELLISNPLLTDVQVDSFLDNIKGLNVTGRIQNQSVIKYLKSLSEDPRLEIPSLSLQEGLLNRITNLDPTKNPDINPAETEELRLYLSLAGTLKMHQLKEVGDYLNTIKLPRISQRPGALSRRGLVVGALGLAGALLVHKVNNQTIPNIAGLEPIPPVSTQIPTPTEMASPSPTGIHDITLLSPDLNQVKRATSTATIPAIPTPSTIKESEPTRTPEVSSLFAELIRPFIEEAYKKRAERIKADPDFYHRVDSELNKDRINFFVLMYGETYEPPGGIDVVIGSPTIISYNLKSQKVEMVSLTHDIRAPEVERHQLAKGDKIGPTRIDQSYWIGSFPLMQRTLEDATGLSGDFQLAISDSVIKKAIDNVYADADTPGLVVDVPFDIDTIEFFQDKHLYPKGHFSKGQQIMTGLQAMQFIKALPLHYDAKMERNIRKGLLIDALITKLQEKSTDLGFLNRMLSFLQEENGIKFDFNSKDLLTDNISGLIGKLPMALLDKLRGKSLFPQREKTIYVVDAQSGDGGVQWVTSSVNPIHKTDLEKGIYADKSFEVPGDGNPYSEDLIKDYWGPVRKLVKDRLS